MIRFRRIPVAMFLSALVGVAALVAGASVALAGRTAAPIGQGVVVIDTNLAYQNASAAGTGIVLTSSGKVLTNNHVIAGATAIRIVIPNTGRSYTATVTGYSRMDDVAVLQLQNASNLKTLRTATATLGQAVRALGNAGGTGRLTSASGTVTGLGKSITASDDQGSSEQLTGLIETNAGIVPGDSGGPLLSRAGTIIGMNVAAAAGNSFQTTAQTDAYAIPIGKALTIAKQIASGTSTATVHVGPTAFIGVQLSAAGGYGGYPGDGSVTPTSGALIAGVVGSGPASKAGLVPGDVITTVNGTTISSPSDVAPIILTLKPGATVTIGYVDQSGASNSVVVTLGIGPAQ